MKRVSNLLEMVAGSEFGQIFITDSNKVRISGIVDSITADRTYFEAAGGVFTAQ
jgi:DNA replication and repair protein RecF